MRLWNYFSVADTFDYDDAVVAAAEFVGDAFDVVADVSDEYSDVDVAVVDEGDYRSFDFQNSECFDPD